MRLAEVGDEGQARLERASARVLSQGLAEEVESRYLRGAGVQVSSSGGAMSVAESPPWLASLTPAAREVAEGAYAALDVIGAVLAETPHPRVEYVERAERLEGVDARPPRA